jgi:hypothetical protein
MTLALVPRQLRAQVPVQDLLGRHDVKQAAALVMHLLEFGKPGVAAQTESTVGLSYPLADIGEAVGVASRTKQRALYVDLRHTPAASRRHDLSSTNESWLAAFESASCASTLHAMIHGCHGSLDESGRPDGFTSPSATPQTHANVRRATAFGSGPSLTERPLTRKLDTSGSHPEVSSSNTTPLSDEAAVSSRPSEMAQRPPVCHYDCIAELSSRSFPEVKPPRRRLANDDAS